MAGAVTLKIKKHNYINQLQTIAHNTKQSFPLKNITILRTYRINIKLPFRFTSLPVTRSR
jgi:hypothetical protein